jgi:hypothetical protein
MISQKKVLVKGADVSNPAKPLPIYLHWTEKILEEFYDQGDEEKRLGLPVTSMPQCDRSKPSVPAGQKGFIAFVVRPIFSALAEFEKKNGILMKCEKNKVIIIIIIIIKKEEEGGGGGGGEKKDKLLSLFPMCWFCLLSIASTTSSLFPPFFLNILLHFKYTFAQFSL